MQRLVRLWHARTAPLLPLQTSPCSYERDVAAKAHRSCPDSYLEAARRGDRAKVGRSISPE